MARERGTLLVLGAGRHQVPLIQRAEAAGYRTVVADNKAGSPGRQLCSVESYVSATDLDGCRRLAVEHGVVGILTTGTDQPIRVMAQLSQELGLPCYVTPAGAEVATNKLVQRKAMAAVGVQQPEFRALTNRTELKGWNRYPCVIKPADSQGQRGVKKLYDGAEVVAAIDESLAYSSSGNVIVEEFVEGQEITANVWLRDGTIGFFAISDRITYSSECLGVCFQHVFPSVAALGWEQEVADAALRIGAAFGMTNGPLYIQMIASENGPVLVEAAARVGGGHESSLLPRISTFDPIASLLAGFEGKGYDGDAGLRPSSAGLVNFVFARAGTVASVAGMASVPTGAVIEGGYYVHVGDATSGMLDGQGRVGYFVVEGQDRTALERDAVAFYHGLSVSDAMGCNLIFLPEDDELARPAESVRASRRIPS